MTPAGVVSVLYSFGPSKPVTTPYSGLVQASDGTLYGAGFGGPIYSLTPAGDLAVVSTLVVGTNLGGFFAPNPIALAIASDANLYGTSNMGGVGATSEGAIFEIKLH
jgi:hypothetical protein